MLWPGLPIKLPRPPPPMIFAILLSRPIVDGGGAFGSTTSVLQRICQDHRKSKVNTDHPPVNWQVKGRQGRHRS